MNGMMSDWILNTAIMADVMAELNDGIIVVQMIMD